MKAGDLAAFLAELLERGFGGGAGVALPQLDVVEVFRFGGGGLVDGLAAPAKQLVLSLPLERGGPVVVVEVGLVGGDGPEDQLVVAVVVLGGGVPLPT